MKIGDKVSFEYWDQDLAKDVSGRGWIKEIDEPNNRVFVTTTHGIKWMEPSAINEIIKSK